MSYVHTFGASSVLQAQFGTSKFVTPLDRNFTTVDTSFFKQQGFADSMTSNFIEGKRIDPSMNVIDWFSNGGYYVYNRPSDDKQYKVNFSKIHGSHIIKAGWDLASTDNQLNIALAQATFTTLQTSAPQSTGTTGSALASYLLGLPDTAGRRNTIETMRWGGVMGMYIQDQWKATPFLVTGYYLAPDWKNAYSVQYNFGIQHQVGSSTVLSATYVGSATHRLDVGGLYNVATTPGSGTPSLRYPYPYIVPQNYTRPWGNASYQSLQLMTDGRFTHGLTYRFSYTWSKSIDSGSSGFFGAEDYSVQNPYNIRGDRSLSGFDLKNVFSASWVYQLPFGTGKALQTGNKAADCIIGNWQFNGIALLPSGAPFNLTVTGDLANTGNTNYLRPNVVGDWHLSSRSTAAWFNTQAFVVPTAYTFGNVGRNVMRADWMRNFDLSLFRQFPLKGDRSKLELRAEAFNAFNTPCYSARRRPFLKLRGLA